MARDDNPTCPDCGQVLDSRPSGGSRRGRGGGRKPLCPACAAAATGGDGSGPSAAPAGSDGGEFRVACAACGAITTVPFLPTGSGPVYCRDCYPIIDLQPENFLPYEVP
jgi:CxxC-x17-CxxC domain-containing protein